MTVPVPVCRSPAFAPVSRIKYALSFDALAVSKRMELVTALGVPAMFATTNGEGGKFDTREEIG